LMGDVHRKPTDGYDTAPLAGDFVRLMATV
jgi:hypothetical protein